MFLFRSLRAGTGLLAILSLLALLILFTAGCSDDSNPATVALAAPPTLPEAEQLQFDFSFFETANQFDKASGNYDNFVNAYLRAVVLEAMAHLVLAAPVTAFSAAVHTVPVAMSDGSWVWTYDWQHGNERVAIRLRGMPAGEVVQWELSLVPNGLGEGVLWFTGTTSGNGSEGHWEFHDLDTEGHPISGGINWGATGLGGTFLEFVCREDDCDGATLRFNDNDPDFAITFTTDGGGSDSFIRWHASGAGSLRVPDYNGGLEACWGANLRNVDCQ